MVLQKTCRVVPILQAAADRNVGCAAWSGLRVAGCLVLALLSACASSQDTTAATTTTTATVSGVAQPTTTTTSRSGAERSGAALQAVVDRWRADYGGVPGAVAAVQIGTGTPLIVATGADVETGAPLDAHVPWAVVSITKTFVGALRVGAHRRQQASASTTQWPSTWTSPTPTASRSAAPHPHQRPALRRRRRRTIALSRRFEQAWSWATSTNTSRPPRSSILERETAPPSSDPGTGVQYSNVNTILLGQIIEKVTGTDLTTALHARLFGPLGLSHTYYAAAEPGPNATPGLFTLTEGGPVLNTGDFPHEGVLSALLGAAAGMVSNVDDLLTWSHDYLRKGTAGHVDLSQSRFAVTDNGLGLSVAVWAPDVGGRARHGCRRSHYLGVMGAGGLPGTNSVVAYFPKWDVTIVALRAPSLTDVDHDLLQRLLEELVGHPLSLPALSRGQQCLVGCSYSGDTGRILLTARRLFTGDAPRCSTTRSSRSTTVATSSTSDTGRLLPTPIWSTSVT